MKDRVTEYTSQELPFVLKMFETLHKSSTKNLTYLFTTIFGILFLFLAISSLWMYKPSTKMFKRGVYLSIAGVSAAVILLVLQQYYQGFFRNYFNKLILQT